MMKTSIFNFFRTKRVIDLADFIVVKIEKTGMYWVYKCRWTENSITNFKSIRRFDFIEKELFSRILSFSERPIVLSDEYIEINDNQGL